MRRTALRNGCFGRTLIEPRLNQMLEFKLGARFDEAELRLGEAHFGPDLLSLLALDVKPQQDLAIARAKLGQNLSRAA